MNFKTTLIFSLIIMVLSISACSKQVITEPENNQIANPASTFCVENGGILRIDDTEQGQIGICVFENGIECEEWAFFRQECSNELPEVTYCSEQDKLAEICTLDYTPVCGDDGVTYGNACAACVVPVVQSYTMGECELY